MILRCLLASVLAAGLLGVPLRTALSQEPGKPIPEQKMDQAAHDMLPDAIKQAGAIKLATDAHYPTCESFASDGKTMVGFEPDLWNAMGQALGVKIAAVSIDFDGLIPGISSGRYDTAIECIDDQENREKQVTFVDYSLGAGDAIYYVAGHPGIKQGDILSLCGLRTAAQTGTNMIDSLTLLSQHCTKHGKPAIAISAIPQASAVILGVIAGRLDFTLTDATAFDELQKASTKPLESYPNPLGARTYMGFIVKRDDEPLAKALLAALKDVHASGTYDLIWDKWRIAHAKLATPGINLAASQPLAAVEP
jgi:polar amino acid transport system substrate-binding protein